MIMLSEFNIVSLGFIYFFYRERYITFRLGVPLLSENNKLNTVHF